MDINGYKWIEILGTYDIDGATLWVVLHCHVSHLLRLLRSCAIIMTHHIAHILGTWHIMALSKRGPPLISPRDPVDF